MGESFAVGGLAGAVGAGRVIRCHVMAPSDVAMVRMLASKRGEMSGDP